MFKRLQIWFSREGCCAFYVFSLRINRLLKALRTLYSRFSLSSLFSLNFLLDVLFQPLVSFCTEDGDACILECLGKSEKESPQDALGFDADGEEHLSKGDDVTGDAEKYDDGSSAR